MSLEQRLTEKLRPHADRVAEGRHNEFDFLPAALLHGLEHGRHISEEVTEFRNAISNKVVSLEQHLADVANFQKESKQQVVEAQDAQQRVILAKFDAIDKYLHEAAKRQSENKEQISEALNAQRDLVVERLAAIEFQLNEAAKQQGESKSLVAELSALTQRRLDRAASDFNKQIGKLTDALDDQTEHSRKRHQASQTILYLCLICAVLTLVAAVALLIKR